MFGSINLGLKEIFADAKRRLLFFQRTTQDEVAMQIRDWRKRRGLTQAEFAKRAGMKQSAVSRLEQAEYAAWSFPTLMKIASVLDGRWRLTFIPSEEAIKEFEEVERAHSTTRKPPAHIEASRAKISGEMPIPLSAIPRNENSSLAYSQCQ